MNGPLAKWQPTRLPITCTRTHQAPRCTQVSRPVVLGPNRSLWCCTSASVPEIQSHGEARESQLQGRRGGGSGTAGIRWKRATGGRIAPPAHLSMSSARSPWFTLCPASSQKPSTTARFATSRCGTHAFHLTSLAVGGSPHGKRRYLHVGGSPHGKRRYLHEGSNHP